MAPKEFMEATSDTLEENEEVKKSDFSSGGDINDGGLRGRMDACVSVTEDRLEALLVLCGVRDRRG